MTAPAVTAGSDGLLTRASFAQERLWFIEALDPESAVYNQLICYRIRGGADAALLQRSIAEVIRRHDALRTNLVVSKGLVYQSISPAVPDVALFDLPGKSRTGDPLEEAVGIIRKTARRPYDLASEPLIRPCLITLSEDDLLLALLTHHTIMDGWSAGIVIREVAAVYEALARGLPAETALPPVPLQYAGYAERQRQAYDRGEYDMQLQYWMERLGGDLPVLDLPFDRPRPALQTYEGRALTIALPPHLVQDLKSVGRSERSTLFMTLLAAYFALLYRYTRQQEIIAGFPVAGRHQLDTEGMIGLCVNTLAIRSSLAPDQTFRELLRQVRSATLEAYENQDLPFEKLVEKLSPVRSLNIPPVFQTLFHLRNFPAGLPSIGGCSIERYEPDDVMVKSDMTLEVTETAGGLSCRFEYPVALFDRDSVARMAGHWQTLLTGIAACPDTPLSGLRILTDEEARSVLEISRGAASRYPRKNIARLFEERAAEFPEAVAVRHGAEQLTYRQLDGRANRLAARLRETGVRNGDIVALFLERSVGMVVAMLAALKAGGVYMPVSPGEPESRIARMLEGVNARAALADPDHLPLAGRYLRTVLAADDNTGDGETLPPGRPSCPEGEPGPDDLAYVMFTSGSTGTPKGVGIPHRGIARLVMDTDYVKIGPGDTVGHLSDPAFDASTFDIWGPLLNGATLAVIDKDTALSPPGLKAEIQSSRIGVLFMTTPLFHTIISEDPSAFCGLRHLLAGGDVMDPAGAMAFLEHCRPARLTNMYGPTENTTFSTYHDVREEDCRKDSIPIGRPIANDSIYILDDTGQPVPVGITGEIYVAGDGTARGYLGSPGLTGEKFLPDPFSPGRMMYRTGDLGRFLPDGTVRFIGRSDGQVKIRGFRVETGEVTSVLMTHPAVRQAVVTAYQGPGDVKSLAGYLVGPDGGARVPAEEIRRYVSGRLPPHMVPSSITWTDAVPLTPRGKVDYRALPRPRAAEPGPFAEPAGDDMTSRMVSVWRTVMDLPGLGPDDDFFNSGGHSLLAIRLIAAAGEAFGVRLPVSTIFSAPTARRMTAVVRDMGRERDLQDLVTFNGEGSRPPLYCVHGVPGTLFEFRHLVQAIGSDQPVYGLESPASGGSAPPERVGDMAERYIRILRRNQPRGPYHLLAFCAAGAIAYEMACRLEAEGERAGVLGIIDYAAPKQEPNGLFWSLSGFFVNKMIGAWFHLDGFVRAGPEARKKGITGLPRFLVRKVRGLPEDLVKASGHARSGYPEWMQRYPEPQRTIAIKNLNAISMYSPGKYQGKVTLFLSDEVARYCKGDGSFQQGFGWEKLTTGSVGIHHMGGTHEAVLRSGRVEQLARIIREEIDLVALQGEGLER